MTGKIITTEEATEEGIIVFLNNNPLKYFFTAQEGEEGWVETIDIDKFREQTKTKDEWIEIPTKTIHGTVEFKRR